MGALSRALSTVASFLPERKVAVGAQIPTWESGNPQYPRYWHNYWRFALEGYSRNELVYTCVEELATSAAEPRLVGVRKTSKGTEQVKDHPILDLFERPNPWMDRFTLIASLVMFRAIAGNAYLEKTRSASGKVVELWPLRPDRVFVVPDARTYIGGWEYRLEGEGISGRVFDLPADGLIQFRTRNAVDDWYGLPPLAVCAERVDTDAMMRAFTLAFFRNAAVPAGLLNITKQVSTAERQVIRDKLRAETGGPQNWHQLMVLDGTEAKFTPMGMPLGQSGIILPELDEISEARIAMAFGVPLELIGARLGMLHGNRSTTKEARATFWDETLVPMYQELAACLSRSLLDEPGFDDLDYLEFDLSTVKALQEDEDAKHVRVRADVAAGIMSVQEGRVAIGLEPEYEDDALLVLGAHLEPMSAEAALAGAAPQTGAPAGGAPALGVKPMRAPQRQPAGAASSNGNGNGNGHRQLTAADLDALRELAAGSDM